MTRISGQGSGKPRRPPSDARHTMTDVDVRSPGSGDSAEHKRKHIVWNEENLSYNEANKSVRRGATLTPEEFTHRSPPRLWPFPATPR